MKRAKLCVVSQRVLAMVVGLYGIFRPAESWAGGVAHLDHIVVVIMENHSYNEVRILPYTSSLVADGTSFSNAYAVTHPSLPNYIALWSGRTQGVTNDACPPAGAPYAAENLGHACEAAGVTWKAYSEDLPAPGSEVCSAAGYARKHAPWTYFSNLDHSNERPYSEFAAAAAGNALPNLAFIVPNQCNDQHDCSLATGDGWLSRNVPAMLRAVGQHGIVVLTYDEDDHSAGNQILTCFVGNPVRKGYVSTQRVTHYTLLRTLCDALGIAPFGAAASETPIGDVWAPTAVASAGWGAVKDLYRR